LPVPTPPWGNGWPRRLTLHARGIGLPTHGGIQETGFRARDEAPSLAYPVQQVRSGIGMAAGPTVKEGRGFSPRSERRRRGPWPRVCSCHGHQPSTTAAPAFTRPRRPRRLTSKSWPDRFPHWPAQDTAILAPANCGWGLLGWGGAGGVAACAVGRPTCFRPPSIGDVSEP
jgi:hypothetical protein